jgi:hypothetical protein
VESTGQPNVANGHPTVMALEWASALWHVRQTVLLDLLLSGGFVGESGLLSCALLDQVSLSSPTQFHPSYAHGRRDRHDRFSWCVA